jgi:hypothetical protein
LQRLVVLTPFDLAALEELEHSASQLPDGAELATRARVARELLAEAAFLHEPVEQLPIVTRRLADDDRERLRHPLAVEHERLLARLKSLTAHTETPDPSTLKLYCERVTSSQSMLARAVDDAATMLGVGHVDIYVSRGHDDIGVRAFEGNPTVLMVGGQHLDISSRYHMVESETRFAVAAELAHLRFDHTRVAPKEVIGGALRKGRRGLDITLSLLPLFAGLKLGNRLGLATAKLGLPQLGRWAQAAKQFEVAVRGPASTSQRSDLTVANEALIEAHRFCQLSADRAGLACAGDLRSALRAMLLCRTDYVRIAARTSQLGLLESIEQARSAKQAAFSDLLMRIGFLVAFYVSDDYEALRRAVHPETEVPPA